MARKDLGREQELMLQDITRVRENIAMLEHQMSGGNHLQYDVRAIRMMKADHKRYVAELKKLLKTKHEKAVGLK